MVRRSAFTLIELIFAIVVMSIVMLSFPMIMQVDSDAREKNYAQEAALAASAKLAQILTYQWDEHSLSWVDLGENHQTVARLVDGTGFSTNDFDRIIGAGESNMTRANRMGNNRRFFDTSENGTLTVNATAVNADNNNTLVNGFEAVIGMDEQNFALGAHSGFDTSGGGYVSDSLGYKRNYRMSVNILRIHDARAPGGALVDYTQTDLTGNNRFIFSQAEPNLIGANDNTNLRAAEVLVTDENNNEITRLYGYSANIGEYTVSSRVH